MSINYDPAQHGGAAFGNKDYEYLKSKGHSDSAINKYIGGLKGDQVSQKYKERGGHELNDDSWKHDDDSYSGFIGSAPKDSHANAKARAGAYKNKGTYYDTEREYKKAKKAHAGMSFGKEAEAKWAAEKAAKSGGGGGGYTPTAADAKQAEIDAYRQSRLELKELRESAGSPLRNVDQSAHYNHLMKTKGSYGGSAAHQAAVAGLIGTGQKFSALDVQREMGSKSTHNLDGLYKAYGGLENYQDNYSVGSGNWQSRVKQEHLGTMKDADDKQRNYFDAQRAYFNSDDYMAKYGNYDWGVKQKENSLGQADRFEESFDKREERMASNPYGSVYGY